MIRAHERTPEPDQPVAVHGPHGLRGTVDPADQRAAGGDDVVVRLEQRGTVVVPRSVLEQQPDGSYFLPLSGDEVERYRNATGAPVVIPLAAEQVRVEKRQVETGRVVVHTKVTEREEVIDEPLMREQVEVDRVPVNRIIEGSAPPIRYEGDTTIVPLMEEVLVVEKRLMLREELRITRRRTEAHDPQRVTLRREEARVERRDAAGPEG